MTHKTFSYDKPFVLRCYKQDYPARLIGKIKTTYEPNIVIIDWGTSESVVMFADHGVSHSTTSHLVNIPQRKSYFRPIYKNLDKGIFGSSSSSLEMAQRFYRPDGGLSPEVLELIFEDDVLVDTKIHKREEGKND